MQPSLPSPPPSSGHWYTSKPAKLTALGVGAGVGGAVALGAIAATVAAPVSLFITVPVAIIGGLAFAGFAIGFIATAVKTDKVARGVLNPENEANPQAEAAKAYSALEEWGYDLKGTTERSQAILDKYFPPSLYDTAEKQSALIDAFVKHPSNVAAFRELLNKFPLVERSPEETERLALILVNKFPIHTLVDWLNHNEKLKYQIAKALAENRHREFPHLLSKLVSDNKERFDLAKTFADSPAPNPPDEVDKQQYIDGALHFENPLPFFFDHFEFNDEQVFELAQICARSAPFTTWQRISSIHFKLDAKEPIGNLCLAYSQGVVREAVMSLFECPPSELQARIAQGEQLIREMEGKQPESTAAAAAATVAADSAGSQASSSSSAAAASAPVVAKVSTVAGDSPAAAATPPSERPTTSSSSSAAAIEVPARDPKGKSRGDIKGDKVGLALNILKNNPEAFEEEARRLQLEAWDKARIAESLAENKETQDLFFEWVERLVPFTYSDGLKIVKNIARKPFPVAGSEAEYLAQEHKLPEHIGKFAIDYESQRSLALDCIKSAPISLLTHLEKFDKLKAEEKYVIVMRCIAHAKGTVAEGLLDPIIMKIYPDESQRISIFKEAQAYKVQLDIQRALPEEAEEPHDKIPSDSKFRQYITPALCIDELHRQQLIDVLLTKPGMKGYIIPLCVELAKMGLSEEEKQRIAQNLINHREYPLTPLQKADLIDRLNIENPRIKSNLLDQLGYDDPEVRKKYKVHVPMDAYTHDLLIQRVLEPKSHKFLLENFSNIFAAVESREKATILLYLAQQNPETVARLIIEGELTIPDDLNTEEFKNKLYASLTYKNFNPPIDWRALKEKLDLANFDQALVFSEKMSNKYSELFIFPRNLKKLLASPATGASVMPKPTQYESREALLELILSGGHDKWVLENLNSILQILCKKPGTEDIDNIDYEIKFKAILLYLIENAPKETAQAILQKKLTFPSGFFDQIKPETLYQIIVFYNKDVNQANLKKLLNLGRINIEIPNKMEPLTTDNLGKYVLQTFEY